MFDHFHKTYGFLAKESILVPYGSRVYGTFSEKSDYDFIAVMPRVVAAEFDWDFGTEYHHDKVNIHPFGKPVFDAQLNAHKTHALEAYFHPDEQLKKLFQFKLNLVTLRHELSAKASNSFVKAKKKIEVEKDYYIGWKSLFHSLRILNFGIQIASTGKIEDFGAANQYWFDILNAGQYDWAYFKDKYQPEYNRLSTEFKKLAPKE